MTSTLGLAGDGDDVDLLADLEASFGIGITDAEARNLVTVGDILALLHARFAVSASQPGKCLTAMAFYRLRRALSEMGTARKFGPATPWREVTTLAPKALSKALSRRTGLRVRAVGGLFAVVGVYTLLLAAITFLLTVAIDADLWFIPIGAALVAVLMLRFDRGTFPDCQTVGDLAKKVAAQNIGRLTIEGARPRDGDLWSALVEVISMNTAVPKAQISFDTRLLRTRRWASKRAI